MKNALPALLLVPTLLTAQKVPLGGDDPRVLQLHDVADGAGDGDGDELARLGAFARTFVEPALGPGEDIQPLGDAHLAVLGRPAQQAWVSRLLEQRARAGDYRVYVEVRLLEVPLPAFEERFAPLFPQTETWQKLQTALKPGPETTVWLATVRADDRIARHRVPRLRVQPWRQGEAIDGKTVRYVKDYEVQFALERAVAVAQIGELLDGTRLAATCALVDADTVGVDFELLRQQVTRPITQFETSLAGRDEKLVLDLPQWRSLQLHGAVSVPRGGVAVVTAPYNDRYAVALVTARVVR